jgi:ribokinase
VITVIGSLNMDFVNYVNRMPRSGETVIGKDFQQIPGGKGANQADTIAKLGVPVKMVGGIGDDIIGKKLLASLQRDGVDVSGIVIFENVSTGVATINVDDAGNNLIIVAPGANYRLLPEHVQDLKEAIVASKIIVCQLEIPLETVQCFLKFAKELGIITILNPAPAMNLDDELLSCVDLLIPNETELELLSDLPIRNEAEIITAAQTMIKRGVKEVIVTVGAKGCVYVNSNGSRVFKAYQVDVLDTTAAGDSFIGAMAVAINGGKTIEDAIVFAMAVAALTVTKKGAQSSLPYRHEVEELLKTKQEK